MSLPGSTGKLAARLLRRRRTPADGRGGRILLVIECLLNQNARDRGAATCPAMNRELVALCLDHDVGLLQIPCPEIRALEWGRERPAGQSIRQALDTPTGRSSCRELALETVARAAQYREAGMQVLGVVGGNEGSPGCAVHHATESSAGPLQKRSGLLMQALREALDQCGLAIPLVPLRDADDAKLRLDLNHLQRMMESR